MTLDQLDQVMQAVCDAQTYLQNQFDRHPSRDEVKNALAKALVSLALEKTQMQLLEALDAAAGSTAECVRDWNVAFAKEAEGFRAHPYRCPAGKLTVGYGRNLDDNGINEPEATLLLVNDLRRSQKLLAAKLPFWGELSPARQSVLLDMCFNMGLSALLQFKRLLAALERQDWESAAREMQDSRWYRQVGSRAERLCEIMRSS